MTTARSHEFQELLRFDLSATILTGLSVSSIINTNGTTLIGLVVPDSIVGTKLTFLCAHKDDEQYIDYKRSDGENVELTLNGEGYYGFASYDFAPSSLIKIVSDQVQASDITIKLITRGLV